MKTDTKFNKFNLVSKNLQHDSWNLIIASISFWKRKVTLKILREDFMGELNVKKIAKGSIYYYVFMINWLGSFRADVSSWKGSPAWLLPPGCWVTLSRFWTENQTSSSCTFSASAVALLVLVLLGIDGFGSNSTSSTISGRLYNTKI